MTTSTETSLSNLIPALQSLADAREHAGDYEGQWFYQGLCFAAKLNDYQLRGIPAYDAYKNERSYVKTRAGKNFAAWLDGFNSWRHLDGPHLERTEYQY